MKNLPEEFILTDFTIEQGNEVIEKSGGDGSISCYWKYLIIQMSVQWDISDSEIYLAQNYQNLPKISYQEWKGLVHGKKFDYTKSCEDIFYKIIYPLFPKEFLFGTSLEEFLTLVNETFILNDIQVDIITKHWKDKENILV